MLDPKCIHRKSIFAKCTRLACLLSFASLFNDIRVHKIPENAGTARKCLNILESCVSSWVDGWWWRYLTIYDDIWQCMTIYDKIGSDLSTDALSWYLFLNLYLKSSIIRPSGKWWWWQRRYHCHWFSIQSGLQLKLDSLQLRVRDFKRGPTQHQTLYVLCTIPWVGTHYFWLARFVKVLLS